MAGLLAGKLNIQINGTSYKVVGDFTINIGRPKREPLVGPDGVHGFSEMPQASSIKGEIRDAGDLTVDDILLMKDATVTADVANGKTYSIPEAFYTGDGDLSTENGTIQFEAAGDPGQEVLP
jgi:hypothetical protein